MMVGRNVFFYPHIVLAIGSLEANTGHELVNDNLGPRRPAFLGGGRTDDVRRQRQL